MSYQQTVAEMGQSFRRAHCDRSGHEHACVGTCIITPAGMEFSCQLCGTCNDSRFDPNKYRKLQTILAIIGLDISVYSAVAIEAMIRELEQ